MKPSMTSRFKKVPLDSTLGNLLSQHDDPLARGFITRLDRSPINVKRLIFLKAFALNIFILAAVAGVAYLTIVRDVLSLWPVPFKLAMCITQDVIIGAAIFVLLHSTTIPFFLGECSLRFLYGFRPTEIVIRKSPIIPVDFDKNTSEDQRMERYWRMASRAVNPEHLYFNAGAMLSSDYWAMEYSIVLAAMKKISIGELEEDIFEFAIWKQDAKVWNVCELWRMHEIMTDRQEVDMFHTLLTHSGKEELLSIWKDMERSPSPNAYHAMVAQFANEGLDYDAVWSQITEKYQSRH